MQERNVKKRKLGNYPFLSVVFSVTLSLFVMGLFGLLLVLTNSLTKSIQQNVEIQVYLNKPIRDSELSRIQRTITAKAYVASGENAENVIHISQEEAARQFIEDTGEDFMEFLGDNPLRDLLIIKVDAGYQSLDSLSMIRNEIEAISGVYEVSFVESLVDSINRNLAKIGVFLIGFSVILLIVVSILINNTIKLAMFSQRFLIRSMQLVGATAGFIRRPFLRRASFYGLMAGMLASAILYLLILTAKSYIPDLTDLQTSEQMYSVFGALLVLGILVTYVSTLFAVRRYLKTSLDELY